MVRLRLIFSTFKVIVSYRNKIKSQPVDPSTKQSVQFLFHYVPQLSKLDKTVYFRGCFQLISFSFVGRAGLTRWLFLSSYQSY